MRVPTFTLDSTGATADWEVKQSAVWRTDCQLLDGTTPINIAFANIIAIVTRKSSPSDGDPLKVFDVIVVDETQGQWVIEISEADADLAPGRYWWAMGIDLGNGAEPLAEGQFIVEPWVLG